MNREEHLHTCAAEEAAEVAQAITKSNRFGPKEVYPETGENNMDRVIREFNDLVAVMEMLQSEGALPPGSFYRPNLIEAKKLKVERMILYSRVRGRVS